MQIFSNLLKKNRGKPEGTNKKHFATISTDEINEDNIEDFLSKFTNNLAKSVNTTDFEPVDVQDKNNFSVSRKGSNKEKVFEMKDSAISFKTPIDNTILDAFAKTMQEMNGINKDSIIVVESCPGGMKEAKQLLETLGKCGNVKFSDAAKEQILGESPSDAVKAFVSTLPSEEKQKKSLGM